MDLGSLRALTSTLTQSAFGVPATVTLPSLAVVVTTGIWASDLDEPQPYGIDFRRREPRRVLAIPRTATLDAIPRGSLIAAADEVGGTVRTWSADGMAQPMSPDLIRVIVVPS